MSRKICFSCPPKPEPRTVENNEKKHSKRPALTRTRYKSKKKVDSAPTHSPTRSKYLNHWFSYKQHLYIYHYYLQHHYIYHHHSLPHLCSTRLFSIFICRCSAVPWVLEPRLVAWVSRMALTSKASRSTVSHAWHQIRPVLPRNDTASDSQISQIVYLHLPNFEFNCMEPHTLGIIWNPFLPGYS